MTALDLFNQVLTVVLAVAVGVLTGGVLLAGRRLAKRGSPRTVLQRAAVLSLRDPNVLFERFAERKARSREIVVSFSRYRAAMRMLLLGFFATAVLLAVKIAIVLLRLGAVFAHSPAFL